MLIKTSVMKSRLATALNVFTFLIVMKLEEKGKN